MPPLSVPFLFTRTTALTLDAKHSTNLAQPGPAPLSGPVWQSLDRFVCLAEPGRLTADRILGAVRDSRAGCAASLAAW